jgi:hypothetical protein
MTTDPQASDPTPSDLPEAPTPARTRRARRTGPAGMEPPPAAAPPESAATATEPRFSMEGTIPMTTIEHDLRRGAIGALEAGDVTMIQGAIGAARADHVTLTQGAIGAAMAGEMSASQAVVGSVMAGDVRIEQSFVRTLVARDVRFDGRAGVAFLLAQHVEGDIKVLFDWRGALAFGAAAGLVSAIVRGGRRRR